MRFGTSAIVRVGRGPATSAYAPSRVGRGPQTGFVPAPPQVRVGRNAPAQTRTGAGPNDPQPGFDPNLDFPPGAGGPNLWCIGNDRVRQEPLGSTRASVPGAGGQGTFLFQPCSPFKLHYFTVPESFALLFTILSLKICRSELIEGEIPAESFSAQAGFVNNIVNGKFAYPSIPARVIVRNDSGAAAFWNGMFYGAVQDC